MLGQGGGGVTCAATKAQAHRHNCTWNVVKEAQMGDEQTSSMIRNEMKVDQDRCRQCDQLFRRGGGASQWSVGLLVIRPSADRHVHVASAGRRETVFTNGMGEHCNDVQVVARPGE